MGAAPTSLIKKMENQNKLVTIEEIKVTLATEYHRQIINYFGNEKQALKFLSGVVDSIQRTPALLECSQVSLVNSFMIMAQLGFMPSAVSGEAYVLPYKNKNGTVAQFQLGYQGIVTLLYKAGAKSVVSEIVREKDKFTIVNGEIVHEMDPFKSREERGKPMGAYSIITTQAGGKVEKFMRGEEIMSFGKRFSKSFGSSFSPWNSENDPEGWMWRKTALKQAAKLAPKNETINQAIAFDNEDSIISDRLKGATEESKGLSMGSLISGKAEKKTKKPSNKKDENQDKENKGEIVEGESAENNAPGR